MNSHKTGLYWSVATHRISGLKHIAHYNSYKKRRTFIEGYVQMYNLEV